MKKLAFVFVVLGMAVGVSACSDDPTPPAQSASGVFPAQAFLGRKVRVEISGDNTEWADGATVSMGDGITVDAVTVSSPTALFADITVADTAGEGTHDVTVTNGGDSVVLKQAFRLLSPIEITTEGTVAQGSVATFTIKNRDLENLFDTTSTGDGFFTPLVFTNIALTGPAGVNFQINNVTPFDIDGFLLTDVDAAASGSITVASGPTGKEINSPAAAPLMVAARTAMPVTAGMAATGNLPNLFDSALYSFTPAGFPSLAAISITGADGVAVLPASGHFADLLSAGTTSTQIVKSGQLYLIPYNLGGTMGSFTLRANGTMLNAVNDTDPGNNTSAGAQTLTGPALVDMGNLTSLTDQDWFKITVPAGKKLHIVTLPGDPQADTLVDVFGPNNVNTQVGESTDSNYHEDYTTPTLNNAGTYFVEISASQQGFFDPAMGHYLALIQIQ